MVAASAADLCAGAPTLTVPVAVSQARRNFASARSSSWSKPASGGMKDDQHPPEPSFGARPGSSIKAADTEAAGARIDGTHAPLSGGPHNEDEEEEVQRDEG